jgi:hypothetical protein
MAIIQVVNVSTPNDGLGDTLRVSQVKRNANESELNDKKVEKVAGFDLSENNFTDTEKAKLAVIEEGAQVNVRGNMQQQDPDAPDYILGKTTSGNIISFGNYSLVGQKLTIFAGWFWKINDVLYSNSTNIVINFPYAATGLQRLDAVVFDTFNSAQRVDGDEVASSPTIPLLIPDSILFSISLITDGSVGAPSTPKATGISLKRFSGSGQTYAIPTGETAMIAYIDGYVQYLEDSSFTADLNTFTQTGNIVAFKTTIEAGSQILIQYYI